MIFMCLMQSVLCMFYRPAEVVSAYNEAFLRNTQGSGNYSESDEDYDDDYDDDDDDESDHFDYGDTTPGTVVRTSKNRKQERVSWLIINLIYIFGFDFNSKMFDSKGSSY